MRHSGSSVGRVLVCRAVCDGFKSHPGQLIFRGKKEFLLCCLPLLSFDLFVVTCIIMLHYSQNKKHSFIVCYFLQGNNYTHRAIIFMHEREGEGGKTDGEEGRKRAVLANLLALLSPGLVLLKLLLPPQVVLMQLLLTTEIVLVKLLLPLEILLLLPLQLLC